MKSRDEVRQKLSEFKNYVKLVPQQVIDYMAQLDELVGLEDVKAQVKKIVAYAKMKKDMAARGDDSLTIALNMEFVGNPGTAKTTVARIIAGIFNQIGLLPSNELIEVGRADLVAKYEGQTADRVKHVFEWAKGKVLFIDEAYSLVENWEGEFGDEAINTIVQEMENNREHTVVIFAGYPNKMEEFLTRNPGLRSRVPFCIPFKDYSAQEMVQIAKSEAKKKGFSISSEARESIMTACQAAANNPNMGNGRFCRNLVESAILNYALRIYGDTDEAVNSDFCLSAKDFAFPDTLQQPQKQVPIGFRA